MKLKIIILAIFVFCLLLVLSTGSVLAADPHLYLSPISGSFSSGFSLDVNVNTGGQSAGGVDVYLEFPKNLLKIENVTKGTAFPEVYSLIKNDEGKLRINAYFSYTDAGKSFNGTDGLIAKINFTPQASGTAAVNFLCTANTATTTYTTESNIVEKATVKDVIICSANVGGSYTVSSEGGTQPTATPTQVSTAETTPTPLTPGSSRQTFGLLGLGILTILTGLVLAF